MKITVKRILKKITVQGRTFYYESNGYTLTGNPSNDNLCAFNTNQVGGYSSITSFIKNEVIPELDKKGV